MQPTRIAELLAPFLDTSAGTHESSINARLFTNISTYVDVLLRWNARINLTAIRDPEQVVLRHFGESLFVARHLFGDPSNPLEDGVASEPTTLADVGSGAGFPGLPIMLWNPEISLTLIEANHKKATFLREVTRSLGLTEVEIENRRLEEIHSARFDIVTLRAVERITAVLRSALGLLEPSGKVALLVGEAQLAGMRSQVRDVRWREPIPIPLSNSRVLLVGEKNHSG